jgi:hypothetical protein
MNDREFLIWIHERLEHVHKEIRTMDFMHKLRNIILAYPADKVTPNTGCMNSLEDLKEKIAELT